MSDPIEQAQHTLTECKERWDDFREQSAQALDDYVNQSTQYVQSVLSSSSTPTDWVKGGVALWIQGIGTTGRLWSSMYQLLAPTPKPPVG